MKNTGNRKGFKGFAAALAAVLLAASLSHTALADGDFSGDITVKNVVAGYEYKVYEVLDCIAAGGETSVYMATEEWKDFLETNENAIAMLTPTEYESGMTDADSKVYTVNMESDKAARKAFAADALQYAQENGIEPTETRTAQDGERDVAFLGLNLGIHVVDTAGAGSRHVGHGLGIGDNGKLRAGGGYRHGDGSRRHRIDCGEQCGISRESDDTGSGR